MQDKQREQQTAAIALVDAVIAFDADWRKVPPLRVAVRGGYAVAPQRLTEGGGLGGRRPSSRRSS